MPVCSSWFARGKPLLVPYEAPQGRRVNVIGAFFTHGDGAGRFLWNTFVSVPKARGKTRKSPAEIALAHGVSESVIGPVDTARFIAFVWRVAGRPDPAPDGWKRECPLTVVLDNYSVHKSRLVKDAQTAWAEAGVTLFYLPAYSPQMSAIEPVWRDVKAHGMPWRTQTTLGEAYKAVEEALAQKA
ncbi:MAG: transposase, partial [Chthonomonadaceae bacterium]|nr:transposase [Chthonomonadaceae bacterium]